MNPSLKNNIIKLRKEYNLSMVECKKLLLENSNNLEECIKKIFLLKKKKRNKKIDKGLFFKIENDTKIVFIKIICETDFVERNKKFIILAEHICEYIIKNEIKNKKKLKQKIFINKKIVNEILNFESIKFGEDIEICMIKFIEKNNLNFSSYLHSVTNFSKKIVTLISKQKSNEKLLLNLMSQEFPETIEKLSNKNKISAFLEITILKNFKNESLKLEKIEKSKCFIKFSNIFEEKKNVESLLENNKIFLFQIFEINKKPLELVNELYIRKF